MNKIFVTLFLILAIICIMDAWCQPPLPMGTHPSGCHYSPSRRYSTTRRSRYTKRPTSRWTSRQVVKKGPCDKRPPEPICKARFDVGFIMDSSGSLSGNGFRRKNHYQNEKDLLKSIAGVLVVGNYGSRAGVVTFSYYTDYSIKLKDYTNLTSFNDAVDRILLMGSTTRIDRALRLAQRELFTIENGGRQDTHKLLILLTDGFQTPDMGAEDPAVIAGELRKAGIFIVVVGIGANTHPKELAGIAGVAGNFIHAASFDVLACREFINKVTERACNIACGEFQCSDPLVAAYYPFGGTWYDISHNHLGKASARNGNKVRMASDHVTIEKQSYVTMPNIDISTGPWTMDYKIRIHTLGHKQYLLANFRKMDWAFLSWVDASGKVTMYLRTNVPTSGSDPAQDMIIVTTVKSVLKAQMWAELKFVWNPSKRSLIIYVDGRNEGSGTVRPQVRDMTLKKSNGDLTWGIKEDSSKLGTLSADIKDFYFYRWAGNSGLSTTAQSFTKNPVKTIKSFDAFGKKVQGNASKELSRAISALRKQYNISLT